MEAEKCEECQQECHEPRKCGKCQHECPQECQESRQCGACHQEVPCASSPVAYKSPPQSHRQPHPSLICSVCNQPPPSCRCQFVQVTAQAAQPEVKYQVKAACATGPCRVDVREVPGPKTREIEWNHREIRTLKDQLSKSLRINADLTSTLTNCARSDEQCRRTMTGMKHDLEHIANSGADSGYDQQRRVSPNPPIARSAACRTPSYYEQQQNASVSQSPDNAPIPIQQLSPRNYNSGSLPVQNLYQNAPAPQSPRNGPIGEWSGRPIQRQVYGVPEIRQLTAEQMQEEHQRVRDYTYRPYVSNLRRTDELRNDIKNILHRHEIGLKQYRHQVC